MASDDRQRAKVRENRLRRAALGQGFVLAKSRTRKPGGRDYGRWWVLDAATLTTVAGASDRMDVDAVEGWLTKHPRRTRKGA